jgi:heme-degrading monooxygenase HmoA
MPYMLVRHKVKDYDQWKLVFEENGSMRKGAGSKGSTVFRDAEDPDRVTVLIKWDSIENAIKFSKADDLRKAMMKAGVISQPDISFLNEDDVTFL